MIEKTKVNSDKLAEELEDELYPRAGIERQAPCYNKKIGHEFSEGECIYCGASQDGFKGVKYKKA